MYIGFTKSEKKEGKIIFYNRSTADASLRQEPGGSGYSPAASVAATGSRKNYWFPFYSIKRRMTPCHVLPPTQLAVRQNSSFRNTFFFLLSIITYAADRYNIQWLIYVYMVRVNYIIIVKYRCLWCSYYNEIEVYLIHLR